MKAKHRFLASDIRGDVAFVKGREVNHARRVLRLGAGDPVTVFDISGNEFLGKVIQYTSKEDMQVEIVEALERESESNVRIHLVMSLCRSKNFELAIQKCTEIGVSSIIPLQTERSILTQDDANRKIQRWKDIAIDAVKQSHRTLIPEIKPAENIETLFANYDLNSENSVIAAVSEKEMTIRDSLENLRESENVYFLIGPEGGFSEKEVKFVTEKGLPAVSLGKRVLRAETAAIYLAAVLFYELEK